MNDIALAEVTRGVFVESVHAGAIVIMDGEGKCLLNLGDSGAGVFPRSAVKLIQALPLIESGIADKLALTAEDLALCCASHNGEARHRNGASRLLGLVGLAEDDLLCGPHMPSREADQAELHVGGKRPGRLYNNCSGKHAGFLCLACESGMSPKAYIEIDHPLQQLLAQTMSEVTGEAHEARNAAIDGCGIPTYAVPLTSLARAFARLATGAGLSATRAQAATRLMAACQKEPFMIAGTDRFCTRMMSAYGDRLFVKTGAEGVFCAAFPALGLGVSLKARDGTVRASEAAMAAVITALLGAATPEERAAIDAFASKDVTTWAGEPVGKVRPASLLRLELDQVAARLN